MLLKKTEHYIAHRCLPPLTHSTATRLDTIHNVDALALLQSMPDNFVNCVVTSPPYNLLNTTGFGLTRGKTHFRFNGYGDYSDNLPIDEYIQWQREIIHECWRVLKPDGAIFYNHKWRVQNAILERHAESILVDYPIRQIVVWDRQGGFNFNRKYFIPSYEVVYIIAGKQFMINQRIFPFDVWRIAPSTYDAHPAPFPDALAEACILASTLAGDIVYDPFMGSGTTAMVAIKHGRHYIGSELNPDYIKLAQERISNVQVDMFTSQEIAV